MRVCTVVVLVVSTDAFAPGGFTQRIRSAGQYYTTSDNNLWEPLPPKESIPLPLFEQNNKLTKDHASLSHQMEILGFQRKEEREANGHPETNHSIKNGKKNGAHVEANGIVVETNGFHVEKNGVHVVTNGVHAETNGVHAESNGVHTEKNGFHTEKNGFHVQEVNQHIDNVEKMLEKNGFTLEKNGVSLDTNGKLSANGVQVPKDKSDDSGMKKWESTEATVPYLSQHLLPPAGGLETNKVSRVSNGSEEKIAVKVEGSVRKSSSNASDDSPKKNTSTTSVSALKLYETSRASLKNAIPKVEVVDKNGFSKTKLEPREKKGFAKPKMQTIPRNKNNPPKSKSQQVKLNSAAKTKLNSVSAKKSPFGTTAKSKSGSKTTSTTSRSQTIKKNKSNVPKREVNVPSAPLFFANPLETWTEVTASRSALQKKQEAPKKHGGPWTYFVNSDSIKEVGPSNKRPRYASRSQSAPSSGGVGDTISTILDWLLPKPKKSEAELEAERAALLAERSRQADESLISLEILPAVSPTTIQGAAAAAAVTALVTGGGLLAIGTAGIVAAGVSITRGSAGETARTIGDWVFEVSTVVAQTLEDKELPKQFTADPEKFVKDAVELTLKLFQLSWVVAETATVTSIKWYAEVEERQMRLMSQRRAESAARALLAARLQLEARERERRIVEAIRRQHEEALQRERERRATEARNRDSLNAITRREIMEERFRLEARDRAARSKARRDAAAQQLFAARVEMEARVRSRRIAEEVERLEAERKRIEEERWAEIRRREEERIAELRRREEERLIEAARKAAAERAAKEAELQELLRKTEANSVNMLREKMRQRTVNSSSPISRGSSIVLRSQPATNVTDEDLELRAVASRLNKNGRKPTSEDEEEEWRTKSQIAEVAGVLARVKKSRGKDGKRGRAVGKKNAIQRLALFLLLSSSSLVSRKGDNDEEEENVETVM